MTIPHQGIGRGRLVPSSHKGSKFRYTIVRQLSRGDERIREDIPVPDSLGKETFQVVWCDAGHDIMSVQKAGWKARLMTGTYMLQATRARFNQHQVDPTCLLCCKEPENVEHFLFRCESLTQVRDQFLHKIYQSLQKSVGVGHFDIIKSNDTVLTTTILDCTTLIDVVGEPVMDNVLHEIESTARGLCFALHKKRTALLSQSN